eukprot:SAG25_NODE_4925_length_730_cov_1.778130_1_plen_126_part_00
MQTSCSCALPPSRSVAAAQGVQLQDYGHYDISYNNPQAPTPTLHALASEGVILNRHYVYQYCSPTRSSFLSGRLPIHVNTANHPTTELGGVDLRMQTVAEALKSVGYQVLHASITKQYRWCYGVC